MTNTNHVMLFFNIFIVQRALRDQIRYKEIPRRTKFTNMLKWHWKGHIAHRLKGWLGEPALKEIHGEPLDPKGTKTMQVGVPFRRFMWKSICWNEQTMQYRLTLETNKLYKINTDNTILLYRAIKPLRVTWPKSFSLWI